MGKRAGRGSVLSRVWRSTWRSQPVHVCVCVCHPCLTCLMGVSHRDVAANTEGIPHSSTQVSPCDKVCLVTAP